MLAKQTGKNNLLFFQKSAKKVVKLKIFCTFRAFFKQKLGKKTFYGCCTIIFPIPKFLFFSPAK